MTQMYSPQEASQQDHDPAFSDYGFYPAKPNNGLRIAAFATGLVALVLTASLGMLLVGIPIGFVLGPTAVVLSWFHRRRVTRGLATDDGLALTGGILGVVSVLLAGGFSAIWYPLLTSDNWD